MRLIWNGHSCFTLETAQGSVVFDPYLDGSVPGLAPLHLTADLVLCSHAHHDHGARTAVRLTGRSPSFRLDEVATFHDDREGALRGPNVIRVITAEGLRAAHLGDLGCRLEDWQLAQLQDLDVMLVPVGGYYTINATQADALVRKLKPRIVVPMHYRGVGFGYAEIGTVEDFLALRPDVTRYAGNALEIAKDTPAQTAVLTYRP